MQDFINKKILLGISGGIAAYKSAYLVRELTRLGAQVRVIMTESAQQFVSPLTFQALSSYEVRTSLFDSQAERAMNHIELARWADYLVVAPASANCLAKFAHGLADDLLSTLFLVARIPVILCPAMNQSMWSHALTQQNCKLLQQQGALIVGPEEGSQACGDVGMGRLSDVDSIINALRLYEVNKLLTGKHCLITAGPTQEALDPVRYFSNKSSGKMGYALAEAAHIAGANVTLISGPTHLIKPQGITYCSVTSAEEMQQQVLASLKEGSIFIGCAAIADYTPEMAHAEKIKKEKACLSLNLQRTADVISAVVASEKAAYVVGFAAETHNLLEEAKKKFHLKKVDMLIANTVGKGVGFESDYNEAFLLTHTQETHLPFTHKTRLAGQIIAILAATLQNIALT